MKKLIALIILTLVGLVSFAQSDDNVSLKFYGFIRTDAYMDTYKGQDLGHDIFYLLPNYSMNQDVEINKVTSANITAIASRLGVRIKGPDFHNATSSGLLEFDFAGNLRSDATLFRIRQAYTMLSWNKGSVLIGQTWHPFCNLAHLPTVAGLNTGAPFHAFNRSPMIRYNSISKYFTLGLSAVAEMQYATPSADYTVYINTNNHAKRNGIIPEMVVTGDLHINNHFFAGIGASYKRIKPRMLVQNDAGETFKAEEFLASTALTGYVRYKTDNLSILAKGFFGENMSHLVMPGGYGVATYDAANGTQTYTCYNHYTVMLNVVYGKTFQVGFFTGFGKNLGTKEELHVFPDGKAKTYGSFINIQDMMRFAPHVSYNYGKYRFVAEYERTMASFGQGPMNPANGLYETSAPTKTNNRLIATATYYF